MKPITFEGRVKYFTRAVAASDQDTISGLIENAGYRTPFTFYNEARAAATRFPPELRHALHDGKEVCISEHTPLRAAAVIDSFATSYAFPFLDSERQKKPAREAFQAPTDAELQAMKTNDAVQHIIDYSNTVARTMQGKLDATAFHIATRPEQKPFANSVAAFMKMRSKPVIFVDVYTENPFSEGKLLGGCAFASCEPEAQKGMARELRDLRIWTACENLIHGEDAVRYLLAVYENRNADDIFPLSKAKYRALVEDFPLSKAKYRALVEESRTRLEEVRRILGDRTEERARADSALALSRAGIAILRQGIAVEMPTEPEEFDNFLNAARHAIEPLEAFSQTRNFAEAIPRLEAIYNAL